MPDKRALRYASEEASHDKFLPGQRVATTFLTPDEEVLYRDWMRRIGHTREAGYAVGPDLTGENYDYRGYFKKYGAVQLGEGEHLTDEFKLPSHPTFSNESIYAVGPAALLAGSWDGDVFTPSPFRGRRFLSQ